MPNSASGLSRTALSHATKRSFTSFCLPLIIIAAALVWALLLIGLGVNIATIVLGVLLTLLITAGVLLLMKKQKKNEKVRLYNKISSNWGIVLK